MASLPPSPSSLLFLLALILISNSPALSTSRQALDDRQDHPTETGFKITLHNVDSDVSYTKSGRLHRATIRESRRVQQFNKMLLTAKHPKLRSTVYPGNGVYLMNFSIGTPPKSYYGIMDTGSDLIWTQCKPCLQCFPQPEPVFDPNKSSSYSNLSCSSNLCQDLPYSDCTNGCEYLYQYLDGTFTKGYLATETFTFGSVSLPKVGFGCGIFNEGEDFGNGLVGLGRGSLSLISQLDKPKFSYCLTSRDGIKPSTLLVGSQPSLNSSSGVKTTPLIRNPFNPTFYYISLEGITIGGTKLPIKRSTFALNADGSGGLIVDSGTMITYLPESAYALVRKEFLSRVKLPVVDALYFTGLDLCFKLPSNASSVGIPSLVFDFKDARLELPKENYMIAYSCLGVMCLAMGSSDSGFSIFGNTQQQNFLVVYDLYKETLSFMPKECDNF